MGNTTNHTGRPAVRRTLGTGATIVAIAALALSACTASDDGSAATGDAHESELFHATEAPVADEAPAMDAPSDVVADADEAATRAGGGPDAGALPWGQIGRDVAVEMRITMRTDDLRGAVEGILAAAVSGGGGVASSDVDFGGDDPQRGRATIVVKVPPRELEPLLGRLDELGVVTDIGQDAVDVTDQLVDLDVRIRNAEQSVDRVRALLADASDLREVIDLESELTRRQTDLERLLASQRDLQERVALATVTIRVLPTEAPVEPIEAEGEPGIVDGLRTGWEASVAVLFGFAYTLAVVAPALVLGLVVLGIAAIVLRSRRRHEPAAAAADVSGGVSTNPES